MEMGQIEVEIGWVGAVVWDGDGVGWSGGMEIGWWGIGWRNGMEMGMGLRNAM